MNSDGAGLTVLGAGAWGTALAVVLAPNFERITLVARSRESAVQLCQARENQRYLPGVALPENVCVCVNAAEALSRSGIVLLAIPSAHLRPALGEVAGFLPREGLLVSAVKGLEPGSRLRMSEVIASATGATQSRIAALSGPSFAQEMASGLPTAVVVAGPNEPVRRIQAALARPSFRVYSSEDVIGVEMGGALKNVVAIGSGMATGLGLGHNAVAALITRGLAEMTRLAVALGAEAKTLSGLAGLGDLVLTCTGELSRNRQLGIALTGTKTASEVLSGSTATTEGVRAAAVAVEMGKHFGVDMPIAEEMTAVLADRQTPFGALRRLMERALKEE